MKIGCLADIHGNFPALCAVLNHMPPVDFLVCAGDVVGYYPEVNEVCEKLREVSAYVIRGNHDAYVTGELIPDVSRRVAYRTDWTQETLSPENFSWLKSLPIELGFSFGQTKLIVRHASPWDEETYLYLNSDRIDKLNLTSSEVRIFGHTHHPFWQKVTEGWILNPGSVGQPRDYDPRPAFAVLDTVTQQATLHRTSYDVSSYQQRLKHLGWDENMIAILSRKRS